MGSEEEEFIDVLERNRFEIVQRLQTERTFLFDYLRSKNVFDSGDHDLVLAEKTRERKAGKFLDILMTKGRTAYNHFIDAIQVSNAELFEKLTGEKASSRPNPIMIDKENFLLDNGTRILDLDIMSNRLNLTTQGLQEMTLRHDQVLKSNQELSKALQETRYELDDKRNRVERLENQIKELEAKSLEVQTNAQKAQDVFNQQLSTEKERINENNTFIIALQMRLLDYKEQIDGLEKRKSELKSENDCLKGKLNEVCKHYEDERRQSMRLTERLQTQKSDIERIQETKRKCRELTFQNQKLLKERDDLSEELEQLKNWTEALKVRYDIVKQEKDETLESHETVVADCSSLRDQSYQLELTINHAKRREEDLAKLNKDLEQAVRSYKKQRDLCEQARKEAIMERDQARIERDEYQHRYKEVVNSRDANINRHMEETKKFEELYEEARKDLRIVKERLEEAEISNRVLLNQVTLVSELAEQPGHPRAVRNTSPDDEGGPESNHGSLTHTNTQDGSDGYNWKQRKTKDVIESLKRRVQPGGNNYRPQISSDSSCSIDIEHETSLDKKIAAIVPQFDNLSPQVKESLSLQRNLPVKMLLTFDTIATMCPSLTNGSSSAGEANRSTSIAPPTGLEEFVPTRRTEHKSKNASQSLPHKTPKAAIDINILDTSLSQPYLKKSSPRSPSEDEDSGHASSAVSDQSLDNAEKNSRSSSDVGNCGNDSEADQRHKTRAKNSRHRKLSNTRASETQLVVPSEKLVKQDNVKPILNGLGENGGQCFDFGEASDHKRVNSVSNESEESLKEVEAALKSPSIRSAPFRGRAGRLSQEKRNRSKTD